MGQAGERTELICVADGVRGGDQGFSVQICADEDTGRFVVRGFNEGGFSCVDIDLLDMVDWLFRLTGSLTRYVACCLDLSWADPYLMP